MYQCDDYQTYIMTCINLMENGQHHDISATITKFLKKYEAYLSIGGETIGTILWVGVKSMRLVVYTCTCRRMILAVSFCGLEVG